MRTQRIKKFSLIRDVAYSTIAYALPTFALYFIIQPLIARHISGEENGLFLALLSLVRFCCNILISPLANLRLLEKQAVVEDAQLEEKFNYLFVVAVGIGVVASGFLSYLYISHFQVLDILLTVLFLCVLFFHDYYSIKFRIDIDFKKVVVDNLLIVCGFFAGLALFWFTRKWQYIFIFGYLFGCVYVAVCTKHLWMTRFHNHKKPGITKRYCELGASAGLSKATVYCDKLLIFPILGGVAVSTYNAASVVSKVIALISVPLRNVLLSYLVDRSVVQISQKILRRSLLLLPIVLFIVYSLFCAISFLLCKFLYPMFYGEAAKFIFIIVGTIIIETVAGLLNLLLLKYRSLSLQTWFSAIKLICYILFVIILTLVFKLGLWGFCIATLLTTVIYFILVLGYSRPCIVVSE